MERTSLSCECSRFAELRRCQIEADREIDEATLLDVLKGATNLSDALDEVIRAVLEEGTMADGLQTRTTTKSSLSRTIGKQRSSPSSTRHRSGRTKFSQNDWSTASYQPTSAVEAEYHLGA